jgi:hypothetical protein
MSKSHNELPKISKNETFKEKFSNYLKEGIELNVSLACHFIATIDIDYRIFI